MSVDDVVLLVNKLLQQYRYLFCINYLHHLFSQIVFEQVLSSLASLLQYVQFALLFGSHDICKLCADVDLKLYIEQSKRML